MSDSALPVRDANCIFCKIINREIPSKVVAEDDAALAISDVNPQAPTHILILPKNHIANIGEITEADLLGRLFLFATKLAASQQLQNGYRLVVNTGNDGGQTVYHLHVHLIGGRAMGWPPG